MKSIYFTTHNYLQGMVEKKLLFVCLDFDQFDMIIGMDDQNIKDLNTLVRSFEEQKLIFRMTDFRVKFNYDHIPDPYYGDHNGFELVLDLLEDACDGLIEHLGNKNMLK